MAHGRGFMLAGTGASAAAVMIAVAVLTSASSAMTSSPTFVKATCTPVNASCNRAHITTIESFLASLYPTPTPTPTVSTSVSPSPTAITSPPPAGCALPAYPDASCTGVPSGTTLTAYSGPATITAADTVIDAKTVTACLVIHAPGVIIKNSLLHAPNCAVVDLSTGGSLTVQDSTLTCDGSTGTAIETDLPSGTAVTLTATRVDISGCENGFDADADTLIQDSYIHDLFATPTSHTDGIQSAFASNITVRHNRIYAYPDSTSAFISPQASVGPHDTLIADNLLAGGAFTLYCPQNGPGVNWRVTGNHFSTVFYPAVGAYGPATDCADETQSGNVIDETGAALFLQ
jgi:hypothetical protein